MTDLADFVNVVAASEPDEAARVLGIDLSAEDADPDSKYEDHEPAPEATPEDEILADMHEVMRSSEPDIVPTGAWDRYQRLLPAVIRDLMLTSVRRDYVRDHLLDQLHEEHLLRGVKPDLLDAVTVRDAWRAACRPERLPATRRLVRQIRDEIVRVLHAGAAFQHLRYEKMPTYMKAWKPKNGVLTVTEVGRTIPSMGYAPYLEATPPQLVRYVYETWLARRLEATEDPSSLMRRKARALDLTGGAGTVHDVLSVLGCSIASYDLTAMNEAVGTLDAREFLRHFEAPTRYAPNERQRRPAGRPDLVFFDPSSRGWPSSSALYWPDADGYGDARDFASLERDTWIETTAGLVKRLLPVLAYGGVVSFLVRHGVRDRGRVETDDQLVGDVKTALGSDVTILEDVRVEYGKNRVNQASLGQARVPATHLLLGVTS